VWSCHTFQKSSIESIPGFCVCVLDFSKIKTDALFRNKMSLNTARKGVPLAIVRGSRRQAADGKLLHLSESPDDGVVEYKQLDGSLSLLPPDHGRSVIYLFGASGSGKSTVLSNYLAEWKEKHPRGEIIVLSRLAEDSCLDELGVKRMEIDESLIDEPITADDFPENCFVVADDVDSISPKKLKDAVYAILTDLLNTGRHRAISVAITSHIGADHGNTRAILNEAHRVVCFPHGSSAHQIRYIATRYCGLSPNQVKEMLKLPSRWVCMSRSYPPCVVYSGGAYMLSKDDTK
jgi:hypothetical protein